MISLYTVICTLVLLQPFPVIGSVDRRCGLEVTVLDGITQPGDIMIGTVLPIHLDKVYQQVSFTERPPRTTCTMFHFESYQHLQALIFAVEEVNKNINILPNISLGFQAYDSCTMLHQDLEGTLQVLTGYGGVIPNYRCLSNIPLGSVVGHSISTHSISVAHILGLYRYPQISHFSSSSLLSDRTKFPSFFRTIPSDNFQSQGLAQLVLHFNWTWVGLLAVDNDYGQTGIQLVKKELVKAGACVAFTETILRSQPNRNAPHIVTVIKKSTANAVVVFSNDIDLVPVLDELLRQNITDKIFIASEAWSTSSLCTMGRFRELLYRTIGFALYSGIIPGFQVFLNKVHPSKSLGEFWVKLLWEQSFSCAFFNSFTLNNSFEAPVKKCTGAENLESVQNSYNDVSNLRVTYNVYTAVHVVAKALEDLNHCNKGRGPFSHGSEANIWNFQPWQLLHYIKKVRVMLSSGRELYFDENGDPPAVYDIVNWQLSPTGAIRQVKVGRYDTTASPGHVFTINSSALLWTGGDQQVPLSFCSKSCSPGYRKAIKTKEPICCFHCVPCPQGEITNHTDSIHCFQCPWNLWPNAKRSRCLQKTVEFLSYEDPLGSTLTSISIASSMVPVAILKLFIQQKATPIVKANNYCLSCLLLACLTFCFLCSLVFIGYPKSEKCLLRQTAFGISFSLCISCVLAKTIMVVFAFLATRPSSRFRRFTKISCSYMIILTGFLLQFILCIIWLSCEPPFPQHNIHDLPGLIIMECNEGSPFAFWLMLAYLGFLASISFIVAFLARRLPDSFNEAKYITFSMLVFLSVWISYIPASLSSQGKYTVAMEIFAILFSSWSLVIGMFLPKCFIILFRTNMNSRDHIKAKL